MLMATAARPRFRFQTRRRRFGGGTVRFACLVMLAALSAPACADKAPFAATFSGTGRGCSGGLHINAQTIDWRSGFSVCKPTPYDILEQEDLSGHLRFVFRLRARSRHCRYEVIEIERTGGYGWNATGYPSLASYRNRKAPQAKTPVTAATRVLTCPMIGPGDR